MLIFLIPFMAHKQSSGYLNSCLTIVNAARAIANTITKSIPELYILGSPPASVIAFASKHPEVNILEVGDAMSKKGWHLNALADPAAVHIACTVSLSTPLTGINKLTGMAVAPDGGHGGCVHCRFERFYQGSKTNS